MKYPLIEGYCKMQGENLDSLSQHLGITRRTLNNKINGISDFTFQEAKQVAEFCKTPMDAIFTEQRTTRNTTTNQV